MLRAVSKEAASKWVAGSNFDSIIIYSTSSSAMMKFFQTNKDSA
jgi:hypothetical protein